MPPVGGKTIQPGFARGKQANRPAGDGNAPLLPPAAASLHGKASHTILSRLRLPTNRVRLPPRRVRFALRFPSELCGTLLNIHSAPLGSMSLDFQVAMLPYKSSSFATPASLVGLWVLSIVPHDSTRKRRADLPLRGRCRRQKGYISTGEARFACFPFAPKARLFGLIIRGGLHHL